MKPLFIGYSESGERIALTEKDLETHVHGIGASRTGKSKLIEWIARELIRDNQGFMLIDPHGFLYEDILRWLTYVRPRREIVLFNPSLESRIVGFNPFRPGPDHISTQVDRRVRATVKAWGVKGTDETPRLERWLRCFYHTLIELDLPIDIGRYFFTWQPQSMRRFLARAVRDTLVRNEWEELLSYDRPQEFTGQIESARNRLFRFILPLQIRRVMGLATNIIDLEKIVEEGKILLVNLQPSGTLSDENAHLIGTLLLNELWEVGKRRKQGAGGKPPSRFFVVIDEFQKFLTQDIPTMLDQSAKYGLHLFLFHQHLSQLREKDVEAYGALTNARTKLVFGGLSREDARTMAEQIFPGQIDLTRIKYLIEQTKFWPVLGRATVHSSGTVFSQGSTSMAGETWSPSAEEWVPNSSMADFAGDAYQEGTADIPFLYPEAFKEVSSVQLYSLEESLWQLSDRLMEQYQRHFMIRRPGEKTVAALTPFVKDWYVSPERVAAYVEERLQGFLTALEVDGELESARVKLEERQFPALELTELDAANYSVQATRPRRSKKQIPKPPTQ